MTGARASRSGTWGRGRDPSHHDSRATSDRFVRSPYPRHPRNSSHSRSPEGSFSFYLGIVIPSDHVYEASMGSGPIQKGGIANLTFTSGITAPALVAVGHRPRVP